MCEGLSVGLDPLLQSLDSFGAFCFPLQSTFESMGARDLLVQALKVCSSSHSALGPPPLSVLFDVQGTRYVIDAAHAALLGRFNVFVRLDACHCYDNRAAFERINISVDLLDSWILCSPLASSLIPGLVDFAIRGHPLLIIVLLSMISSFYL